MHLLHISASRFARSVGHARAAPGADHEPPLGEAADVNGLAVDVLRYRDVLLELAHFVLHVRGDVPSVQVELVALKSVCVSFNSQQRWDKPFRAAENEPYFGVCQKS